MKKLICVIVVLLLWASPSFAWVDASGFLKVDERGMNSGPWFTYNNGEIELQYRTNFDFTPSATLTVGKPYVLWEKKQYGVQLRFLEVVPEIGWVAGYSERKWSRAATVEAMVTFNWMQSKDKGLKTFSMWQYVHKVKGVESFLYQWAKVMWQVGVNQIGFQEQVFVETSGPCSGDWFIDIGPSYQRYIGEGFSINFWHTWPVAEKDDQKLFVTLSHFTD